MTITAPVRAISPDRLHRETPDAPGRRRVAQAPNATTAISLWRVPDAVAAPSERVVAAILQFGDVRDERDDGATLIRFTRSRLEREDMQILLCDELDRALDVSLLWDEREEQLLRVIDVAPLRQGQGRATPPNRYADAHMRSFPRQYSLSEPVAA